MISRWFYDISVVLGTTVLLYGSGLLVQYADAQLQQL